MKIFTSKQIHELDAYTIEHEPVTSINLMERSAVAITTAIARRWPRPQTVIVFAGPGNNGGDALAVARLLAERQYDVTAYLFNIGNRLSADCQANKLRLRDSKRLRQFVEVTEEFDPPKLTADTLVVDGLFGSGLNKPLSGGFAALVRYLNAVPCTVASIDLPSGLMSEDNSYNVPQNIIRADMTLTLQMPKLCMFLADCQQYLGTVEVLPIGLSEEWQRETPAAVTLAERDDIVRLLRPRSPFSHKGNMGHGLLIAGSWGMAGAAVLAARAALRSGIGKVTAHIPQRVCDVMQAACPEAVCHLDKDERAFSEAFNADGCAAVAIGPGLGQREATALALISQIHRTSVPLLLDADALNIIGARRQWLTKLPPGTLLTPHPKEFDSLDGDCTSDSERLMKARDLAQRLQGYIILKGHHSALCQPDGTVILNTTGNGGMATAGCGDVLTGIILALMARGYATPEAALVGMYLHGLAGDMAAREKGEESLIASDIIEALPKAFLSMLNA